MPTTVVVSVEHHVTAAAAEDAEQLLLEKSYAWGLWNQRCTDENLIPVRTSPTVVVSGNLDLFSIPPGMAYTVIVEGLATNGPAR